MLKITSPQVAAFSAKALGDFESRALRLLQDEFPEHFAFAGEERMRLVVRNGQQKALLIGFHTEQEIVKYLVLQQYFGSDVDTNPDYPQLRAVLNDQDEDPAVRIDRAMQIAARYLDKRGRAGGAR